jgi:hypothetical protein
MTLDQIETTAFLAGYYWAVLKRRNDGSPIWSLRSEAEEIYFNGGVAMRMPVFVDGTVRADGVPKIAREACLIKWWERNEP